MPYVVMYCMLIESIISPQIQGLYPDYKSAKEWVGEKKGYWISELPSRNNGSIQFHWTAKGIA
jgi:hypothetical protein